MSHFVGNASGFLTEVGNRTRTPGARLVSVMEEASARVSDEAK